MPDILIRGMDKPKSCNACMFDVYGLCLINKYLEAEDELTHDCPLKELPEHGDLIDARRISEQIDDIWDGRPLAPIGAKVLSIIDSAPAIIPANKEETHEQSN